MAIDDFSLEHHKHHSPRKARLVYLEPTDEEYLQLENCFQTGWKHPDKRKYSVRGVFKVLSPDEHLEPYLNYRSAVEGSLPYKSLQSPGNECLLFHGTNRACLLGEEPDNVRLCFLSECSLCRIIQRSFDVSKCGSKHKFTRFGTGIYTTACSSKADDYSFNGSENAKLRVLLVNRVVVGRPFKKRRNATTFCRAPAGYHSVIGEPGEDLNYEETVVYSNDAIRPAYLVVYGDPPVKIEKHKFRTFVTSLFKTPLAS
ncbi:hypothetical protein JAAARDRAFT_40057 [Jaapia argillacea MUCL 33604]|uniref:PARP catalytic domain-containing protein n=1 Tax=Jaapia argillacea MUCL 33604 TaxID=933084 RepID=A0A067PR34_9AGAM|nr:hypothetical protein JAAARDRAFT_40057 [Jaapia argillacea MUCL 33604]